MSSHLSRRLRFAVRSATLLAAATLLNFYLRISEGGAYPWTLADTIEPTRLAAELTHANGARPAVLYVGFRTLFEGGHIADATFHGTASTAQGLADLKKWAMALPRATNLVIYCGCCPFDHCPNIRPAFVALHAMGFTHLRVLALPKSFAVDWLDRGFPVAKGL